MTQPILGSSQHVRSLWALPDGAAALPEGELPGSADIVVAGAGVVGATTALLLAEAGRDVVLLDLDDPLQNSTTIGSTAKVTAGQGMSPARLAGRRGGQESTDHLTLTRRAMEFVAARAPDDALRRWSQEVYGGEAESRDLRRSAGLLHDAGFLVDDTEPSGYTLPDQWGIHPGQYLQALLTAATGAGVRYRSHTRVDALSGHGPVTVRTTRGEVRARSVVVATHYPFPRRGGWFALLSVSRHHAVVVRAPDGPLGRMTQWVGPDSRSTRPVAEFDGDDRIVVVGPGHPTGSPAARDGEARWAELCEWAHVTFGADPAPLYRWAAQDTSMPDHLPVAGPLVPGRDDVQAVAGLGGWGMTNGTIAAHQLVQRLLGAEESWGDWSLPRRPSLRGLLTVAQQQVGVTEALVTGLVSSDGTTADDLLPGEGAILGRGPGQVAVCRGADGALCAVSARCPHMGCTVAWNAGEQSWDCPCHGSRFAPDGSLLEGPAHEGLAPVS